MAQQFKLVLKSGPDNLRLFPEKTSTATYKRGELVRITGTAAVAGVTAAQTGSQSAGILGVAAKDAQGTTTPTEKAEVYVVTPEQVWELHAISGKKPSTCYVLSDAYKWKHTSDASFTITREHETASATISMRGPVVGTTVAGTANQGLIVVGYSDDATKGKKGQKVLVRFTAEGGPFKT